MGTFIIRPTVLVSGGTPIKNNADVLVPDACWARNFGSDDATILECFNSLTGNPGVQALVNSTAALLTFQDTLRFSFTGLSIYLDGLLTPIAFATLPAGFTPTSASVLIDGGGSAFNLQQGPADNGVVDEIEYPYTIPVSILHIWSSGIGYKANIACGPPPNPNAASSYGHNLRVEGVYEIVSFSWTLVQPTERVDTGDIITVTSDPDGVNPLDLDTILTITITYTDENGDPQTIPVVTITHIDSNTLTFVMPDLLSVGDPPGIVIIEITSSEFSGSVELGRLVTIYFLNAPGIYRIVAGKTNDTLYDIENGGTVDVKIPNPTFKTGFIDG